MTASRKERAIVLTGACGGIGRAIARLLAQEGVSLVLVDADAEYADRLVMECVEAGARGATFVHGDVAQEETSQRVAQVVSEQYGTLAGLVNNAGTAHVAGLEDTELSDWERVMNVNATSVFLMTRACASLISSGGAIVNVASVTASIAGHGISAYAASKGAVVAFTRCLAVEMADRGVRVNSVSPGLTRTQMGRETFGADGDDEERDRLHRSRYLLGRYAEPLEIAEVVSFLLSPRASFITGTDVIVDGGKAAI